MTAMTHGGDNPTTIDKNANTAAYHRPPWMDDATWQQVSADLTEHWLTLLETAAKNAAHRQQHTG